MSKILNHLYNYLIKNHEYLSSLTCGNEHIGVSERLQRVEDIYDEIKVLAGWPDKIQPGTRREVDH